MSSESSRVFLLALRLGLDRGELRLSGRLADELVRALGDLTEGDKASHGRARQMAKNAGFADLFDVADGQALIWNQLEPVDICPTCKQPGHPVDTDDLGRHPECQPEEERWIPERCRCAECGEVQAAPVIGECIDAWIRASFPKEGSAEA